MHDDLLAPISIHNVVGADAHFSDLFWNDDAALTTRERLFIHVRVKQCPGEIGIGVGLQHVAIRGDHIPSIGIVVPPGVGVLDSDAKSPGALALTGLRTGGLHGPHVDDVGVALPF